MFSLSFNEISAESFLELITLPNLFIKENVTLFISEAVIMTGSKITFYIVRHGKTLFNKFKRMQGYCDSPLTQDGVDTARDLAFGLKDIDFSAAYSSTSERATDTAEIILENRKVELVTNKNLKEIFFGDIEGEREEVVRQDYPGLIERFHSGEKDLRFPNGENLQELVERISGAFDKMINENKKDGGNILVVSHGCSIINFVLSVDNSIEIKDQIPNSSVTKIIWENGKYIVEEFGSTKYFENGKKLREIWEK